MQDTLCGQFFQLLHIRDRIPVIAPHLKIVRILFCDLVQRCQSGSVRRSITVQVIQIPQGHAVCLAAGRLNVSGHCQIQQKPWLSGKRFQLIAENGIMRTACCTNDDFRVFHLCKALFIGNRFHPKGDHRFPVMIGTQCHKHPAATLYQ